VVPDPLVRWLTDTPGRDPFKAPKDRRQAQLLWRWLSNMARYPVDSPFLGELLPELQSVAATLDLETPVA
jgi:hypothetical protein